MSDGNGDNVLPARAGRFAGLAEAIQRSAPEGWRQARNEMFLRFEALKKTMPPFVILKLALEFDRHAMACELHAASSREHLDAQKYTWLQQYLAGAVDVPPTPAALTPVEETVTSRVDREDEEDDDGEDDET